MSKLALAAAALASSAALALPALTIAAEVARPLSTCNPPKELLAHVTTHGVHLGEDGGEVLPLYVDADVAAALKRFKDARPDRVALTMRIDDGVSYERIVGLVDAATGLELRALRILTGGKQPLARGVVRAPPRPWCEC